MVFFVDFFKIFVEFCVVIFFTFLDFGGRFRIFYFCGIFMDLLFICGYFWALVFRFIPIKEFLRFFGFHAILHIGL